MATANRDSITQALMGGAYTSPGTTDNPFQYDATGRNTWMPDPATTQAALEPPGGWNINSPGVIYDKNLDQYFPPYSSIPIEWPANDPHRPSIDPNFIGNFGAPNQPAGGARVGPAPAAPFEPAPIDPITGLGDLGMGRSSVPPPFFTGADIPPGTDIGGGVTVSALGRQGASPGVGSAGAPAFTGANIAPGTNIGGGYTVPSSPTGSFTRQQGAGDLARGLGGGTDLLSQGTDIDPLTGLPRF